MLNDNLIKVLSEINNRLNDIALTLQVIRLMNASIDRRENGYNFLSDLMSMQKEKYIFCESVNAL